MTALIVVALFLVAAAVFAVRAYIRNPEPYRVDHELSHRCPRPDCTVRHQ